MSEQPPGRWFYLSTERMTIAVRELGGIVVEAPPIVRKFIGQPTRNLGLWLRKQPGFRVERIL